MLSPLGQGTIGTIHRAIAIVGYICTYDESGTVAIEKIAKLGAQLLKCRRLQLNVSGEGLKIGQLILIIETFHIANEILINKGKQTLERLNSVKRTIFMHDVHFAWLSALSNPNISPCFKISIRR